MKSFAGLLILASLALGVISTPLQSQQSVLAVSYSTSYELELYASDEALGLPNDIADDEFLAERRAADAAYASVGIRSIKTQLQIILGVYVTVQQAFQSIRPSYTLKQIYGIQRQVVAFINAIVKVCGVLSHTAPCTSKRDARALTSLVSAIVDCVCHLLIAICGALNTFKQLKCVYIWSPLVLWLEAAVLAAIDAMIIVVGIDNSCKTVLGNLKEPFKLAVADAIKTLGK